MSALAAEKVPTFVPANTAHNLSDLHFVDALVAAQAIRKGQVSSVELTSLLIRRIEQFNSQLNAFVTLNADEALARARAADKARQRNEWWGPLHGVPCSVKDTFETAGVRTTAGAQRLTSHVPEKDSTVVARLRAAGAVILGKTNVPEWGADWQTYNDIFGATNNPWDLARTPGGSSGGSATALAAGLTYLSVGSDIAGSIRIPAHFCGVYGHKPTLNVVPFRGHVLPLPGTPLEEHRLFLPVAGPMARSASDLKTALEIIGGPDAEDATAYRWSLPAARASRLSELRIGFVLGDPRCPVSSEVGNVIAEAVAALRKVGAKLEEGWPPGVIPAEQYETYLYLLYSVYAFQAPNLPVEKLRSGKDETDVSYRSLRARAWTDSHKHHLAAHARRMAARAVWLDYFRTHDAFLLPTAFLPAFPHDHNANFFERRLRTPEGLREYMDLAFWASFATLTGLPATTAPVGLTRGGLPVSLQIIGPYLEDATPIDVAVKLAEMLGGFRPPKGY